MGTKLRAALRKLHANGNDIDNDQNNLERIKDMEQKKKAGLLRNMMRKLYWIFQ